MTTRRDPTTTAARVCSNIRSPVHCVALANRIGLLYVCDRQHDACRCSTSDGTFVKSVLCQEHAWRRFDLEIGFSKDPVQPTCYITDGPERARAHRPAATP